LKLDHRIKALILGVGNNCENKRFFALPAFSTKKNKNQLFELNHPPLSATSKS
jgi:hypothetical protein